MYIRVSDPHFLRIRIQKFMLIRIRAGQKHQDPCGSGSETLMYIFQSESQGISVLAQAQAPTYNSGPGSDSTPDQKGARALQPCDNHSSSIISHPTPNIYVFSLFPLVHVKYDRLYWKMHGHVHCQKEFDTESMSGKMASCSIFLRTVNTLNATTRGVS